MTQKALFFESIEEAAKELARHYEGGPKELAQRLRPTKSPSAAHSWWLDCCNPNRLEHNFTGDDWLMLVKIGREIGCHAVMHYVCDEAHYERAVPNDPEDELSALLREWKADKERDRQRDVRIERALERTQLKAVER